MARHRIANMIDCYISLNEERKKEVDKYVLEKFEEEMTERIKKKSPTLRKKRRKPPIQCLLAKRDNNANRLD